MGILRGKQGNWPDREPTDREIAVISECIGIGFRTLGYLLNFSKAELDQITSDNHALIDRVSTMLFKWRQRHTPCASIATLLKLIKDRETITVNWEKLMETFKDELCTVRYDEELHSMLLRFRLLEKYPEKITVQEAFSVSTTEYAGSENDLAQAPWILLHKILAVNCNARDFIPNRLGKVDDQLVVDLDSFFEEALVLAKEEEDISTLDIFLLLFYCCDPFLQQIITRKLFLSCVAVPFIGKRYKSDKPLLFRWPLQTLLLSQDDTLEQSDFALDVKTHVLTFCRLGRPNISKATIVNAFLYKDNLQFQTFFSSSCKSGNSRRVLSDGIIEIFWIPESVKNGALPTKTLLNLRGDFANNFDRNLQNMLTKITNVLVVVIEINELQNNIESYGMLLKSFSMVIFVISGEVYRNESNRQAFMALNTMFQESKSLVKFIQTKTSASASNSMYTDITNSFSSILSKFTIKDDNPLNVRLRNTCEIDTWDFSEDFVNGDTMANDIMEQMQHEIKHYKRKIGRDVDDSFSCCRPAITPCSSELSMNLNELLRKVESARSLAESEQIHDEVFRLRKKQLTSVTKSTRLFIEYMTGTLGTNPVKHFLLGCLKQKISIKIRNTIHVLKCKRQQERDTLFQIKLNKNDGDSFNSQKCIVMKIDNEIDKATFGIEMFLREIAHVYDAALYLGHRPDIYNLPPIDDTMKLFVDLVLNGYSTELLDGDSLYLPMNWIISLTQHIHNHIQPAKVLPVSILGLQSSGKSTFLNTIFGAHFSVRSGRCTRGVHAQLMPVTHGKENEVLMYVLIIDSEGLRASELFSVFENNRRDNEIATLVTGLGKVTLVNIMGEAISDMRDVLQIVVNALLRLRNANSALQKDQMCIFVHQNVCEGSAKEKTGKGFENMLECLDSVTEEAASEEGLTEIARFNDVLRFDIDSHVFFVPNLWQGKHPLKRVNPDYSEVVEHIKYKLFDLAKLYKMKELSDNIKSLGVHIIDLWKGIIAENFVFSFRNRLEIKAYLTTMELIANVTWDMEMRIRRFIMDYAQGMLCNSNNLEDIQACQEKIKTKALVLLDQNRNEALETVDAIFNKNLNKDVVMKWRHEAEENFDIKWNNLKDTINIEVSKYCDTKHAENILSDIRKRHKKILSSHVTGVANTFTGVLNPNRDELNEWFDEVMASLKDDELLRRLSNTDTDFKKVCQDLLYEYFKNDNQILKNYLELWKNESSLESLRGSFGATCIIFDDIGSNNRSQMQSILMAELATRLNEYFIDREDAINTLCSKLKAVQTIDVSFFFSKMTSKMYYIKRSLGNMSLKKSCVVKVYIHILSFACMRFKMHNKKIENEIGLSAQKKKLRSSLKITFDLVLQNQKTDQTVADIFSLGISEAMTKIATYRIPIEVRKKLIQKMPVAKYDLLRTICTELAYNDNFYDFMEYITEPKLYAKKWFRTKSSDLLFLEYMYRDTVHAILIDLKEEFKKALNSSKDRCNRQNICTDVCISDLFACIQDVISETCSFKLDKREFESFLELQPAIIQDVNKFIGMLLGTEESNGMLQGAFSELVNKLSYVDHESVLLEAKDILDEVWGCEEACPFCKEPCAKGFNHTSSKHMCLQHRPLCCTGVSYRDTDKVVKSVCNYSVFSNEKFSCSIVNDLCKCKIESHPQSDEEHPYREYNIVFPDWDISPSSNAFECSLFWLWFVGNYKEDLRKAFKYDISDIPESWQDISYEKAIASLCIS